MATLFTGNGIEVNAACSCSSFGCELCDFLIFLAFGGLLPIRFFVAYMLAA